MPRRRQPGYYVSVHLASRQGALGLPSELLDGPWPTREAAERRAHEVEEQGQREGASYEIVRIAADRMTIVRGGPGEGAE